MSIRQSTRPVKQPRNILQKRAQRGFRGYPVATVAYYGPNDTTASKVAVGIIPREDQDVTMIKRWNSEDQDVRWHPGINQQIMRFIEQYDVRSVAVTNRIIGCPHEEGVDYPYGKTCPQCPFWTNRNRWTGELISSSNAENH